MIVTVLYIPVKKIFQGYRTKTYLPVIVSIALVAETSDPSMASSNTRSRGSQRAERLAPWQRPAEEARDPKAITAWNFCRELDLHFRDKTMRVSDVKCRRASGVITFEFLNADEFAPSSCIRWRKTTQCVGLAKQQRGKK